MISKKFFKKIKIILPSGDVIYNENVTNTFRDFVKYAGIDNTEKLGILKSGYNIITIGKPNRKKNEDSAYTPYPNGKLLYTDFCTKEKLRVIQIINEQLNLKCRIIEIN